MSEELSKRVISAKQKNAVQLLELYGIDIGKLNAIQHETNETMKKIADDYAVVFRKNAEEKASTKKRMATATISSTLIWSRFTCIKPPLEEAVNCLSSTSVDPFADPVHAIAEAECDKDNNLGQLRVELHGLGGDSNVVYGEAECELVFVYEDNADHSIREGGFHFTAHIEANGFTLLQIWSGGGCSTPSTPSAGALKIFAQMEISQAGNEWLSDEYIVADSIAYGPPKSIDVNTTLWKHCNLASGMDVTVKVKFRIEASLTGSGQLYADLKTSEFFNFKVPKVEVCRHNWVYATVVGLWHRLRNIWELGAYSLASYD